MDFLTTLFIAIGLSADAFAVSVARSLIAQKQKMRTIFTLAFFFGLFQAFMPILGWLAGMQLISMIAWIDHWVAFALLAFVGGKMIYESGKIKKEEEAVDGYALLMLSIATSIDALAVGFSLSVLKVEIFAPAAIIGLVTFIISLAGGIGAKKFGHLFEEKVELAGGLILILIGIKIVVEHMGWLA